ncbi:meiotic recombination protein spo11 [Histoplasma capsulatum var. duboisii H88]|uniref:Meiotic recombination protein spo11 n=1 Tax=Ajellomyces capsulatus (strain H88) TaxID=544711 RepID=A0A8A1LGX3_AJEC8|nr:meiotic recombination protein spo11 [Histoplasma capsulatum var. duboisii H88]
MKMESQRTKFAILFHSSWIRSSMS